MEEELGLYLSWKPALHGHFAEIPREFLRATIEHAIMRFQHVIDVNGAHVEHIL